VCGTGTETVLIYFEEPELEVLHKSKTSSVVAFSSLEPAPFRSGFFHFHADLGSRKKKKNSIATFSGVNTSRQRHY
jgi:hypothetical protein